MCPVEQQSDPLVGTMLDGRYRVDTTIATGGMSTVYRGLDVRLDRPVALKVMDSRYSGDSHFLTRFGREAKAVARLKDPGLVAVYDQGGGGSGTFHQPPFLVMELIEGGTLRELLAERGPMPPHAVAAVLAPVLGGLAVAHRARPRAPRHQARERPDLRRRRGQDRRFRSGARRRRGQDHLDQRDPGDRGLPVPEQVSTGDADPRSDVYAVGILTYELLTGVTPFTGDSALTVAYQRMDNDVPAPSLVIAGVPTQFDQFVRRATARDPGQRFADADEMRAELTEIVDDLGLPAFRVPAPQHSAQHLAATRVHDLGDAHAGRAESATVVTAAPPPPPVAPPVAPAPRQPTREITRDQHDWAPIPAGPEDAEYSFEAGQFAGIEMSEFHWARQRAKRALAFWVIAVLTLTGLVAAAAWTLGSHVAALL